MVETKMPMHCSKCKRRKSFPDKHSCKTCIYAYTSKFVLDKAFDTNYQLKLRKKEFKATNDNRLRLLYSRIRERYFEEGYLPHPDIVTFNWKRGGNYASWCSPGRREIRMGGLHKFAFVKKSESTPTISIISDFNEVRRRSLVDIMIHEAIHLRIHNHRKHFRTREVEIKAKVRNEDIPRLYEGLVTAA